MFNGVEYYERRGDKHKYTQPKLKVGDTIKLLYNDEDSRPKLPGERRMTRGNYIVQQIRTGFSSKDSLVYVLVKNGAKYKFCMFTIPIDKAIEAGVIEVKNS
jgi:hypothetical protein